MSLDQFTEDQLTELQLTDDQFTDDQFTLDQLTEPQFTGSLPVQRSWLAGVPVLEVWVVVPVTAA